MKRKSIHWFKAAIIKSKSPIEVLNIARVELLPLDYTNLLTWIYQNDKLNKNLLSIPFPKTYSEINSSTRINFVSFKRDTSWCCSVFTVFCEKINIFIKYSQAFEKCMLFGNYEEAGNLLNTIEAELGVSVWLINKKIAYLQYTKGLESQKKYSNTIKASFSHSNLLTVVVHYISYRNEPTVAPSTFEVEILHLLDSIKTDKGIVSFIKYHLLPYSELKAIDLFDIIRISSTISIIDLYEAFIFVSKSIFETNVKKDSKLKYSLKYVASKINELGVIINDRRIHGLSISNGATRMSEVFFDIDKGKELIVSTLKHALLVDTTDYTAWFFLAKISSAFATDALLNEKSVFQDVFTYVKSVSMFDNNYEQSIINLLRLATNFYGFSWADFCIVFAILYTTNLLNDENQQYINLMYSNGSTFDVNRFLLTNGVRERFSLIKNMQQLANGCCDDLVSLYAIGVDPTSEFDSYNANEIIRADGLLFSGIYNYYNEKYDSAIKALNVLANSELLFYKYNALRMYTRALLSVGRIKECIHVILDSVLENINSRNILPIAECVSATAQEWDALKSSIDLSILLDIYVKYFDSSYERKRNYAYEDFLESYELEKPSQLYKISDAFDVKYLVYYLNNVCIENVLDNSIYFESSQDIMRERLSVCRLLIAIDEKGKETYQSEIKDIQRKIMIKERGVQVELSKIYVDTEGLKISLPKGIQDKFNRYLSLIKEGIDADSIARIQAVIEASIHERNKKDVRDSLMIISIPQNETYALFESLIYEIMDHFLSNSEHGLDAYLSVRIRHGTLSGHLRSSIEQAHLITQRESSNNAYKKNKYWLDRLSVNGSFYEEKVSNALTEFSTEFDKLINTIIAEWIQIKKKPEDKGLFDFMLSKDGIKIFSGVITEEITINEFVDEVFQNLFYTLEQVLSIVRDRIILEAKPKANDLFIELNKGLNQLPAFIDASEINAAIHKANNEVQLAFDRTSEWFRLSKTIANEPFYIEDAVAISLASIKTINSDFDISIKVIDPRVSKISIKGIYLPSYVDMLFNVFENIAKYSGDITRAATSIELSIESEYMTIKIENNVLDDKILEKSRRDVIDIKNKIKENRTASYVKSEGGSGFFKIQKILTHDFATQFSDNKPVLNFGYESESSRRFFVEIYLPVLFNGNNF
ncbi:hypothetical protein Q5H89_19720 [Hymenobacter sp. CA2-7]|nr:hypothetical protein [Hymenobacter sp. CA2-7]